MGYGRWSAEDWKRYSNENICGRGSVEDIYSSRNLHKDLDPKDVSFRESLDNIDNPNSTPIIIGLDVTGSMGFILEEMAREGLKELATEIYNRKPIEDPQIMFMGIGDVKFDRAPLQVTQFEADIRIAEQLTKLYLEKGGGGNNCESYTMPWYFASMHTKCDNYIKRGKKGYLFTIGDECPPKEILREEIERVLGYNPQFQRLSTKDLYNLVSRQYEVFHIVALEGSYARMHKDKVMDEWRNILGQRVLPLEDHKKISELIVSTLQIMNGESKEEVINSWDNTTSLVLENAFNNLTPYKEENKNGFIKFCKDIKNKLI